MAIATRWHWDIIKWWYPNGSCVRYARVFRTTPKSTVRTNEIQIDFFFANWFNFFEISIIQRIKYSRSILHIYSYFFYKYLYANSWPWCFLDRTRGHYLGRKTTPNQKIQVATSAAISSWQTVSTQKNERFDVF